MKYTYSFTFSDGYGRNVAAHSISDAIAQLKPQVRGIGCEGRVLVGVTRHVPQETHETEEGRLYLYDIEQMEGQYSRITKDELCKLYGVESYDVALPQEWLEQEARALVAYDLYENECGAYDLLRANTVMRYDGKGNAFGSVFYLTAELVKKMRKLEALRAPQSKTV